MIGRGAAAWRAFCYGRRRRPLEPLRPAAPILRCGAWSALAAAFALLALAPAAAVLAADSSLDVTLARAAIALIGLFTVLRVQASVVRPSPIVLQPIQAET